MSGLSRLWPWRMLAATLTAKELKARYRGSALGLLWTLLNPLFMMLVYTLVFSVYMRVPMENYAVFVFAGLLPWLWFQGSLAQGAVSVVREGHLLRKVSFPAEILPLVAVAASSVNFLLSLPLYFAFALVRGVPMGWSLLWLPVLLLVGFLMMYGLALLLAALEVLFRDVEHLTGNLLTLLFFLTPILYTEEWIPERFRGLALANPAAALVLCFKDVLFHGRPPRAGLLAAAAAAAVLALVAGSLVFRSLSPRFAEEV